MWKKLAQETSSSNFQKDVSARLKEMGIEHVEEFLAEEGLFSIDIAFSGPNGMRVAMEVDGPFHYTCNTNQPMGHTLLRWDPSGLLFSGPPPPPLSAALQGVSRRPARQGACAAYTWMQQGCRFACRLACIYWLCCCSVSCVMRASSALLSP